MAPAFDPDVTSYAVSTSNATNTITATPEDPKATVEILNGDMPVENGSAATWKDGFNDLVIKVTVGDVSKEYKALVCKSLSSKIILPPEITGPWGTLLYGDGVYLAKIRDQFYPKISKTLERTSWEDVTVASGSVMQYYTAYSYDESRKRFVCVSGEVPAQVSTTKNFGYSDDGGKNWTIKDTGIASKCSEIACGNGVYVAIDGYYSETFASKDYKISKDGGETWEKKTAEYKFYRICFGDGKFVALVHGPSGLKSAVSTDGIAWEYADTALDVTADGEYGQICYGDGKFVCCSEKTNIVYSTDGLNWQEYGTAKAPLGAMAYDGEKFIAALSVNAPSIYISTNGFDWIH